MKQVRCGYTQTDANVSLEASHIYLRIFAVYILSFFSFFIFIWRPSVIGYVVVVVAEVSRDPVQRQAGAARAAGVGPAAPEAAGPRRRSSR